MLIIYCIYLIEPTLISIDEFFDGNNDEASIAPNLIEKPKVSEYYKVLKKISDDMEILGLNYEFMEWTSDSVYPYFVGEYTDVRCTNGTSTCEKAGTLNEVKSNTMMIADILLLK